MPEAQSPLARAREDYLDYLQVERGLAANSVAAYARDTAAYLAFLSERNIVDPDCVTRADVEAFAAEKRDAGFASASIERALSAVKGFHRFMVSEGTAKNHPTAAVRLPKKEERLPDYISVEQAQALLDQPFPPTAAGERDRAMLEVLYGCGLRVSELVGLDLRDLYLDEGFVRVFGKGSKERIVPMGRTAVGILRRYLEKSRPELISSPDRSFQQGSCHDRAEPCCREHSVYRKARCTFRFPAVADPCCHPRDLFLQRVDPFSGDRRSPYNRRLLQDRSADLPADLLFYHTEPFLIHKIALVQHDKIAPHAQQFHDIHMLSGLRHDSLVRRDHKEHQIHPCHAGSHIPDKLLMSRDVDDPCPLPVRQVKPRKAQINGDTPAFFFLQPVRISPGQGADQCCLPMIDMSCGSNDHMAHLTPPFLRIAPFLNCSAR